MIDNEMRLFWEIVSELRQGKTDKLSDDKLLILLEELEVIAVNTTNKMLAARARAEIAGFGEVAAAAPAISA